ncbi:MAG: NlpC/P60 family protein [Nitrospiraceae bacterium]|nr:NlpC/P60 family protein [Nitrospiraceae bacterium]
MIKKFIILFIFIFLLSASQSSAYETYKVKKGDTLSHISKKFKVSIRELRELNNLKPSSRLKIRQVLIINTAPRIYTVRSGDTLEKIAKKYNLEIEELKDFNRLETDEVKTGKRLFIEQATEDEISRLHLDEELARLLESEEIAKMNTKDRLIFFAKKFLEIPYRFGGSSVMGIDCSAYVKKVYELVGIELPRSARLQYKEGESIDKDSLSIGDLVFFRTYAKFPSHVGIYLGSDLFIHASSYDRKVEISDFNKPYYQKRFIGAKRFIQDTADQTSTKEEKQELKEEVKETTPGNTAVQS